MPGESAIGYGPGFRFPTADDAPPHEYQMRESMVMFDLRPASAEEIAMSVQIDEIHDQLARGIPMLQREMEELLVCVRRPGLT